MGAVGKARAWLDHVIACFNCGLNGHGDVVILSDRTGMSSDDLPDSLYRDWYDDGVKTWDAAVRAIKNARES